MQKRIPSPLSFEQDVYKFPFFLSKRGDIDHTPFVDKVGKKNYPRYSPDTLQQQSLINY